MEGKYRELRGALRVVFFLLAAVLFAFHLYTSATGTLEAYLHRSSHLTLMLMATFIVLPLSAKRPKATLWIDLVLASCAFFIWLYQATEHYDLLLRAGDASPLDLLAGGVMIVLILEATRRAVGPPMVLIMIFFLFYAHFGRYFPRIISHGGYSWSNIIDFQFLTLHGIYGIALGVMATFIVIFIIFGALLASGVGEFFIDLAISLFGKRIGGPAKSAVIASACFGTISGSAVANVVSTGAFTIPLMKRGGYSPEFAAGVEAAASSGGQIMPPIMGASAFLIAEFLGIPYIKVCLAAAFPAMFYFFTVYLSVHFRAQKRGLRGVSKEETPNLWRTLRWGWYLCLPVILLVVLLALFYTPMIAGFWAIVFMVLLTFVRRETRLNFTRILTIMESTTKNCLGVAMACAGAGIIIGCTIQSGLTILISNAIFAISGGYLIAILFFTMLVSLLLGMGLPTVGAYVIIAILVAPSLVNLGVLPIGAHLFAFYFAIISAVTPPVAIAAYAGAGISGSDPFRTGLVAFKLALPAFIVPFAFILNPGLLLQAHPWRIVFDVFALFIASFALASGIEGYFFRPLGIKERLFCFLCIVFMIMPGYISFLTFVSFFLLLFFLRESIREKWVAKKITVFD
jgi:TRAP transporter 4TM/12TM fusion protein